MKKCKNCGTPLEDKVKSCFNCGESQGVKKVEKKLSKKVKIEFKESKWNTKSPKKSTI